MAESSVDDQLITSAEIEGVFKRSIPPIRTAGLYRAGLVAVVACLLALQLIYVALVAAVAIGVGYYFVLLPSIFAAIHINWITIVLIASPPVAGAITFFFLFIKSKDF